MAASSSSAHVARWLASLRPEAFDNPHSIGSSPLGKRKLDSHSAFPASGGEPLSAKRQKVVETSFDDSRSPEVRNYMNKKILDLAQKSREVYLAKIEYERLHALEVEMRRRLMEELKETQGNLDQMEGQTGQIRKDLFDGQAASESNVGQCGLGYDAKFPQDCAPSGSGGVQCQESD